MTAYNLDNSHASPTEEQPHLELARRVEALEIANRLLKRRSSGLFLIAMMLFGVIVLTGLGRNSAAVAQPKNTDVSKLLRARAVEIVDKKGDVKLRLSTDYNGGQIKVFDEIGKKRIDFGMYRQGTSASEDSPHLSFYDRSGDLALSLSSVPIHNTYMILRDASSKNRIRFQVWRDRPSLELLDEKGDVTWHAP